MLDKKIKVSLIRFHKDKPTAYFLFNSIQDLKDFLEKYVNHCGEPLYMFNLQIEVKQ